MGELFPLLYSHGSSTCYFFRLHAIPFATPRYYKDVYVNSCFTCTDRIWNSLSSGIAKSLELIDTFIFGFLLAAFQHPFHPFFFFFFFFFFCNSVPHNSCAALHEVNPK